MIKLTHKYYTFNARKPWFIRPIEYLFVHSLMLLGTQSFHYRVCNNENHCIYLRILHNKQSMNSIIMQYKAIKEIFSRTVGHKLEAVLVYISKPTLIAQCKGWKFWLCLQLAQFLAQPRRLSNKHTYLSLACIWIITRLCAWTRGQFPIVAFWRLLSLHTHTWSGSSSPQKAFHTHLHRKRTEAEGQESAFAIRCWTWWQQPNLYLRRYLAPQARGRSAGPFSNHLNEIFIASRVGQLAFLELYPNLHDHSGNSLG